GRAAKFHDVNRAVRVPIMNLVEAIVQLLSLDSGDRRNHFVDRLARKREDDNQTREAHVGYSTRDAGVPRLTMCERSSASQFVKRIQPYESSWRTSPGSGDP